MTGAEGHDPGGLLLVLLVAVCWCLPYAAAWLRDRNQR